MTELVITKLGHLGDGLAEGIAVPGALPGETVTGTLEGGTMPAPRIVTPSPDRVTPPCPHARACGGCVIQHGSNALVSEWKRGIVADALRARGIAAEVAPPLTSPPASRRRAGFSGRRTKKGAMVGFHGPRSHTLVEVPACRVIAPRLAAIMPHLGAMTMAGGSRKGEITYLATETLNGPDLAATGGKPLDLALHQELVALGAEAGLARLSWNGEQVAQWAAPEIRLGSARVALPPGAFLQATAHGQAALTAAVEEITAGAARIADLFCGCGTFALPLSARADVLAFEAERPQVAALQAAWNRTEGLHQLRAEARDLFRRPLMADELKGVEAVVIDPPRAGAAAQMAELAKSAVPVIASVSCSPSSFARDAAILIGGGYEMGKVTVVDQFRWSPHAEIVAGFVRRG
ncbi:class I SAM-dependent RNA methyltransferase [Mangrovicoccus algicola]|uniref:Class I SAM-dependent RNA methyltransferase n=1 Tax=Mangrovicoccus algicola TaxID=2771008 RepID=A0A8J7CK27_9RHOB|nr:class I SAM-dependent RNA methyltransferase [Mangrovicoccus algicola]MBE3638236.1 class I SAM-dependent RNA methyltransferase [Mangrovicoccus algicola]